MSRSTKTIISSPHSVTELSDIKYNEFVRKYAYKLQQIELLNDELDNIDKLVSDNDPNVPHEAITSSIVRLRELYKNAYTTTKNHDFLIAIKLVKELTKLKETYKENTKIENLHKRIEENLYRCQTGDALPINDIMVKNNNGNTINTVGQLLSHMMGKNPRKQYTIYYKKRKTSSGKKRKTKRKTKRKYN